jgi:hypothetical protein
MKSSPFGTDETMLGIEARGQRGTSAASAIARACLAR